MGYTLNDETRRLLDAKSFAAIATLNPDGGPQTSVIWVSRDGNDVLFSTLAGRRKHKNLERDPRASITVIDPDDPYNYVELRGTVSFTEDVGREYDRGLWDYYMGKEPPDDPPGGVRVIGRMVVSKATGYAA